LRPSQAKLARSYLKNKNKRDGGIAYKALDSIYSIKDGKKKKGGGRGLEMKGNSQLSLRLLSTTQ
jgi:hypothetical protein